MLTNGVPRLLFDLNSISACIEYLFVCQAFFHQTRKRPAPDLEKATNKQQIDDQDYDDQYAILLFNSILPFSKYFTPCTRRYCRMHLNLGKGRRAF
jgi:hypothetical protein